MKFNNLVGRETDTQRMINANMDLFAQRPGTLPQFHNMVTKTELEKKISATRKKLTRPSSGYAMTNKKNQVYFVHHATQPGSKIQSNRKKPKNNIPLRPRKSDAFFETRNKIQYTKKAMRPLSSKSRKSSKSRDTRPTEGDKLIKYIDHNYKSLTSLEDKVRKDIKQTKNNIARINYYVQKELSKQEEVRESNKQLADDIKKFENVHCNGLERMRDSKRPQSSKPFS